MGTPRNSLVPFLALVVLVVSGPLMSLGCSDQEDLGGPAIKGDAPPVTGSYRVDGSGQEVDFNADKTFVYGEGSSQIKGTWNQLKAKLTLMPETIGGEPAEDWVQKDEAKLDPNDTRSNNATMFYKSFLNGWRFLVSDDGKVIGGAWMDSSVRMTRISSN